ncbi:MAG: M2 family metallopeptidase [Planctomycetota bacterium]|nr:M2 family metallopeptidase [Planctomycetota bacterium]
MRTRITVSIALLAALAGGACFMSRDPGELSLRAEVQRYLDRYGPEFQRLTLAAQEAQWASQTRIVPGDETAGARVRAAEEALAEFTGSTENIELARAYLRRNRELSTLQVRELETILRKAGGNPQTARTLVQQRIAAETKQTEQLYGFAYELDGKRTTTTEIDAILRTEADPAIRLRAWEASKAVGPTLREGLVNLRNLRNEVVRALGYADYFAYMASEYGMKPAELAQQIDGIQRELRPLYRELHTWARYELARRYGQPVPDLIPAHWLPDRWGQEWSALAPVEGFDLDGALHDKSPQWLVEQGDRFYQSLGFEPLPPTFWERSSLLPVAADAGFSKNNHASAWHMDLDRDVRCLMSVVPTGSYYETIHHELGHIHYYLQYSTPQIPVLMREGASRACHEAFGSMMGLAAMQPRFIQAVGLDVGTQRPDPMRLLLQEALNYVVFMPWSAGVMFEWEREIYTQGLPAERWNQRWWQLVEKYQGIAPPGVRDERWCDPATKTHVNDDPAAYYDYALSYVLLFQLHDHIAHNILREDPHDTCYFGRREVGDFLKSMMRPGATIDWIELLREKTGSPLSARPMVDYFEPLRRWLVEQNRGRVSTLPPL